MSKIRPMDAQQVKKDFIETFKAAMMQSGLGVNYIDTHRMSLLMWSAKFGLIEEVKLELARGANVNHKNKYEDTALIYAIEGGFYKIIKLLLKKGADVNCANYQDCTALMIASSRGHIKIVRLLLTFGAKINHMYKNGWTALAFANHCKYDHIENIIYIYLWKKRSNTYFNKIPADLIHEIARWL